MCDCPDQFSVLDDRTPAHPLDDPARFFKELRVRHLDDQSLIDLVSRCVDICHLDFIVPHLVIDKTAHERISCHNFGCGSSLNGDLFLKQLVDPVHGPVDSRLRILVDRAQDVVIIIDNDPLHRPRTSVGAFYDILDACLIQCPVRDRHEHIGVCIVDSMSESAEPALLRQEGDGTEPLYIVPHPDSKLILIRRAFHRPDPDVHGLPAPPKRQHHAVPVKIIHRLEKF